MSHRWSRRGQILKVLSERLNQAILYHLNDAGQPLHIEELTEELLKQGVSILDSSEYETAYEWLLIALHHDHLPRLARIGLVTYDPSKNVVACEDYRSVDPDWLAPDLLDELLARFGRDGRTNEENIGIIEGRQQILEYGRQLVDAVKEEVFCMYADAALFEEECIRHTRAAIERGVALYAGTRDPTARELTRKYLPGATVWEPQMDWLNSSTAYPKVGRFIFADREKLMIAIVNEPGADDPSSEIAMVGEGDDNPLVVLVRELLGPRLDHLDYQSADFRSKFSTVYD